MHWIIQNNLYSEEGFESLIGALDRLDSSYSIHKCVPFAGNLEPEADPPPGPVVVMGSYTLARHAQARGWTPGAWLSNLDFRTQADHWGPMMFNYDCWVGGFKDVPEQLQPFFMRPVHDTKSFTGMVVDWHYYQEWLAGLRRLPEDHVGDLTLDTLVMVCPKQEIYTETRFWIIDQEVVTSSQYKTGSRKHYQRPEFTDPHLTEFAERCAKIWSPNRAYVLDVFDGPLGPRIGEINNLNSAGFYLADMNKLVLAIEEMP